MIGCWLGNQPSDKARVPNEARRHEPSDAYGTRAREPGRSTLGPEGHAMKPTALETQAALPELAPIHYEDTFTALIHRATPVTWEEVSEASKLATPKWADALGALRNLLVGWTGLKTFKEQSRQGTGLFDLFQTLARTDTEVVLGEQDRHLDFRVVMRLIRDGERQTLSMTTQVKFNNGAGRFYFFCIKPFHRLIVWRTVKKLERVLQSGTLAGRIEG